MFNTMKTKQLLVAMAALPLFAFAFTDGDFIGLTGAEAPDVRYAVERTEAGLSLEVRVGAYGSSTVAPHVEVVAAAAHEMKMEVDGKVAAMVFQSGALVNSDADWKKLRLALRVSWPDGNGGFFQRERFFCTDGRAPHADLPASEFWLPLDLDEHARIVADRKARISFDFAQPMDGKATIVVEDEAGKRIRNLVSGADFAKGRHEIVWDGLDENGRPVPPGNYSWRAISHPGISPKHLFSFCNGPGSNHGTLCAATTDGELVFVGTPVSEGGKEMVALRPDGTTVGAWVAPHGHGLATIALAAGDGFLYGAYDGTSWGQKIDRSKPDWKAEQQVGLVRIDLKRLDFSDWGKQRILPVVKYTVGPGAAAQDAEAKEEKREGVSFPTPDPVSGHLDLCGLAYAGGKLYLASWYDSAILVLDPANGQEVGRIPLAAPGTIAATPDGAFLLAISNDRLLRINIATGATDTIIASGAGHVSGIAAAPDGRIFLSDSKNECVRVLLVDDNAKRAAKPRVLKTIGTQPGGEYKGDYDPERLINPRGLAFAPDGRLWITEGRWTPKRLAIFDPETGKVSQSFFGPTAYGAPGGSFDPLDHERWIAQGTLFDVDFETGKATPRSVLGGKTGSHYSFWRQDGRTFIISFGKANYFHELMPDGTMKPFACISSAHQFAYYCGWNPPQAFLDAFERDYPANGPVERGSPRKPNHGFGMLWVDRNGDGEMQSGEIEFATTIQNLAGSGWGHGQADLTIRIGAMINGKASVVTLKPDGYYDNGVPRYPYLADAIAEATPLEANAYCQCETTVDRFGDIIYNSDPNMMAFSPDGKLLWTYPNRWTGVHGSHNAPLPKPGELQGVLFFTGIAKLDDVSDVMVMNGNHGRLFAMTSDGLYLDEMFHDVRVSSIRDAYMIGGECFGGTFGLSEKDGNYYLQAGGIEYRVFRLDGLRETKRSNGSFSVNAAQVAAAERAAAARAAEVALPAEASLAFRETPPAIDGKDNDWPKTATLSWSRNKQFPVSVRAAYDDANLYLCYSVKDDSPWVNNGDDWQSLFKTGDSVDIQLGTDATAAANRSGPVPGDIRLLIAPQGLDTRVVLYRHRLKGGAADDAVTFQSPWRSERVDSVSIVRDAEVSVSRNRDNYTVEASIPLAAIGFKPAAGAKFKADFGVIYGDTEGTINLFRNYWANPATMLVNDVPGEIMLSPRLWGTLEVK